MTLLEPTDIANVDQTQRIIQRYHLQLKKSLGQNFLTSATVLADIIEAADLRPSDSVLEIGPGIGALTEQLAKRAGQVHAFEIDRRLWPILDQELVARYANVIIEHHDILQVNLPAYIDQIRSQHDGAIKIVANLPYYITTPIMMNLLPFAKDLDSMVLMMQKEVAQRLIAQPGSRDYNSLSIAVQTRMQPQLSRLVPKSAFVPQPKVDSAVVRFVPLETPFSRPDGFDELVRVAFAQPRKTLANNLFHHFPKNESYLNAWQNFLDQHNFSPSIRAQQLAIADFVKLAQVWSNASA